MTLEIAVDSVADAIVAIDAGADRVELCDRLDLDGVTPPVAWVREILVLRPRADVAVMVCPVAREYRFGAEAMPSAIAAVRELVAAGARGIVLGAIDRSGTGLDVAACRALAAAVKTAGAEPVFHRVIDTLSEPRARLDELVALGFARVLTSGGRGWINVTTEEGMLGLAELMVRARGRIGIVAGGGVRSGNVAELVRRTGVREVHSSAGRVAAGR